MTQQILTPVVVAALAAGLAWVIANIVRRLRHHGAGTHSTSGEFSAR